MSITSDIRSYADTAVTQGKQALGSTVATAQAQLSDATGAVTAANDFVGRVSTTARDNVTEMADKAAETVQELREQAEKAVNLDALTAAIEPYLAQLKEYTSLVTDKVDGLLAGARQDPRFAKLVETAELLGFVVLGTVNERVIKPVQFIAGMGKPTVSNAADKAASAASAGTPTVTKPARKPATTAAARKPATTKPTATKPVATRPATTKRAVAKPAATKSAAKPATKPAVAKSAPARRSAAKTTAQA